MHVSLPKVATAAVKSVAGEDDDDLYESLARARRAADKQQKQGATNLQDTLAEQLASRRDQDEAHQAMDTDRPSGSPTSLCCLSWPAHPVCIILPAAGVPS